MGIVCTPRWRRFKYKIHRPNIITAIWKNIKRKGLCKGKAMKKKRTKAKNIWKNEEKWRNQEMNKDIPNMWKKTVLDNREYNWKNLNKWPRYEKYKTIIGKHNENKENSLMCRTNTRNNAKQKEENQHTHKKQKK